ncbi:MAG TPA: aldehyde dehydrogenase family protein [Thermoanaerobaculia bacterium]|nr:aldehyde dehydrogenase family protein [Thermoanaerobaculia bacterium]
MTDKTALLLVDLQNDFLSAPDLEPAAGELTRRAAALLQGCRERSVPVIHVWTTVRRDPDNRMPHWRRAGRWACVEGTAGHAPPGILAPLAGEPIVHKTFFSAFSTGALERLLRSLRRRTLLIAGTHLHACVRETVLDAYQRGFDVVVAEDAVASDDPLHAVLARRWLEARAAIFQPVAEILASLDGQIEDVVEGIEEAVAAARRGFAETRTLTVADRAELLARLGSVLAAESEPLARQMAREVGKPVRQGRAEVARSIALLEAAAGQAAELERDAASRQGYRYQPLGVVAAITPWNNPLGIPLGKIGPAVAFGNTVVWKPAPAGAGVAVRLLELMRQAGWPPGWVQLVTGGREAVERLIGCGVDGVTLSGSPAAGRTVSALCARHHLPLQAELGGNNGAIVWGDVDLIGLDDAARRIVDGAFAFAGQRCTANRRVILDAAVYPEMLRKLEASTAALSWGDPFEEDVRMGPLISAESRERVAAVVERAAAAGATILSPQAGRTPEGGAWHPPVIVVCDDPQAEIVQEETFGPVLVVQRAEGWEHALDLLNGVRQGLAAALFSRSEERRRDFLARARAGILKIGEATADAAADLPFGGWKSSGLGPPEHGPGNRELYTRAQAIYQRETGA